jgi:hypothetical protein
MDIEQAMRAMAPLPDEELRLAFGVDEAPWPPQLTDADIEEARTVRFACWISKKECAALMLEPPNRRLKKKRSCRGARLLRGVGAWRGDPG